MNLNDRMNNNKASNYLLEFWTPVLLTFTIYLGIRNYIFEARYIPSGSMLPGLQINDRLLIEKLTLKRRSPKRGEIVVFNSPFSFDRILGVNMKKSVIKCAVLNFPIVASITGIRDPVCDAYIKRVVAIPGDKVLINTQGEVIINNIRMDEPYVKNYCFLDRFDDSSCPTYSGKVPNGHVLVLGDNRENSWDSRFWPAGPFLPEDQIIGKAIWRFWPISRFGYLYF